jgi:hypothetical protein
VGAEGVDIQSGNAESLGASVLEAASQSSESSGVVGGAGVGTDDSVNQSGNAESVSGVKAGGSSVVEPLIQSGISESDSLCGMSHEG